jgi:hypothetical protein
LYHAAEFIEEDAAEVAPSMALPSQKPTAALRRARRHPCCTTWTTGCARVVTEAR